MEQDVLKGLATAWGGGEGGGGGHCKKQLGCATAQWYVSM